MNSSPKEQNKTNDDIQESSWLWDKQLHNKSKEELIHSLSHLALERERHLGVIEYQKKENEQLNKRLLELSQKLRSQAEEDEGDNSLLPLLEALEEEPVQRGSKLRQILIDAFQNKDSKYYRTINSLLVFLIFFSAICVTLESVPSLMEKWGFFFHWSELIVVGFFTLEYIINIYVAEDKIQYIFGLWGLIDLVAIIPSYFHFMDLRDIKMARTLRIIRFLRTIRMMRVLKMAKNATDKYHDSAKQRVHTLQIDLQIYFTSLFTIITIFSTLIYYAERNVPDTPFVHIPAAMWWCVVTITTVGYGDMYPSTFVGKIIGAFAMVMGLALLGLLMNVIGKVMMTSLFGTSKIN